MTDPSSDWCKAISNASPGDEIVLAPGAYATPCWITAQGTPTDPIIVRSQSEEASKQAVLAYSGSTSNVLELRNASHVVLRGLAFGPTQENIDAIRIRRANDVTIERCVFRGIGGISITANGRATQRITIRDNVFQDLRSTAIYLGCHDGADCISRDILIERNIIDGVESVNVGYGIQVKLNSYGIIKDNTIYRTKGPGIMVYGSNRDDPPSVVEGNYVEGSRNEAGIVIGGGPAIVRNNVVVGNAYGGVSAQNYGRRDLQRAVWIVHNTMVRNEDSGINVAAWRKGRDNVVAFNAILPLPGTPALRPSRPAGTIADNKSCDMSCFVNATTAPYDLRPSPNSPLINAAGNDPGPWCLKDDFMGVIRDGAADVGAFERTSSTVSYFIGRGSPRPARILTDVSTCRPD